MGGNQSEISNIGTQKGQGYRILSVKPNSPLQPLVDPFFDFIVDVIPTKESQKSPKDILSKLTQNDNKRAPKKQKNLQQIFKQNQNSVIVLKIVSTKYRNVKTVQVTPNKNWNGPEDLMGLSFRLQRYDEAFQTYFPFSDVRPGSPVKKSGINDGQYLIGCLQFQYNSINELLQNLYDRYFDKAVQNKTVNFAVYNLLNDGLRLVPVLLSRGWGEKGLLGCQFLEGHLNKFPKNLLQMRDSLKLKKKISDDNVKIKKQLSECNGASVQLIESLKNQKYRKKRNIKHLKNILLIQPSHPKKNAELPQVEEKVEKKQQKQGDYKKDQLVPLHRFKQLQNRVATLEQMLSNVRNYIQQIESDDQA